jgi:two-component system chemotaxis sensor kinase CheA
MNIRQRIVLLVVLSLSALAVTGLFSVYQSAAATRSVKAVTEGVVPSASKSVALLGQLKDVHLAATGILEATDKNAIDQALKTLELRQAELQAALDDQMRTADSAAQRGLVEVAQEGLQAYFASIKDTAQFKINGQNDLASANLAATATQYLREQGEMMTALQVEKNRSKDTAIAALNSGLDHTKTTLAAMTAIALAGLLAVGIVLYRQIVLPIAEMERKMTEVAASQDFSQRLPVQRKDEIGKSMLAFNAMIGCIQESTALVAQKTADIHAMLHAIPQGILTIGPGGLIHPEYSEHLRSVLETDDISGRDVIDLVFGGSNLGSDVLSQLDAALAASIGEDQMNFEFNAHLLPTEFEKTLASGSRKVLDLNWSPMTDAAGVTTRLLLCVRDVTELRALARAAEAQRRELALIGEILAVPQEKFTDFIDSAVGFVAGNAALIARGNDLPEAARLDLVAELFRNMHTIKGNARTLGLTRMAGVAHDIEETYDAMRKGRLEWDGARLAGELQRARTELHEHATVSEHKLGRVGPGRRGSVEKFHMVAREQIDRLLQTVEAINVDEPASSRTALASVAQALQTIGTERIDDALAPVLEALPALAGELGKAPPQVKIDDHAVRVRQQLCGTLRNACMHLLRNALDHGIEPAAERVASGKPAAGAITLTAELDARRLRLTLQDDGRGLALQAIRDRAVATGLLKADAQPTPAEVAALIFHSGLSTARTVTNVSGRGVGMDAARSFVSAEGGQINLELLAAPGADGHTPFRTVITLPARLALRVEAGSRAVASHA